MDVKAGSSILVPLLIFAVLAVGAIADGTVEEAGISIVEVPVFVTDRDGNPVLGLTEKDFEVSEDGTRQGIEVFMPISMDESAETPAQHRPRSQTQKAQLPRYELRRHFFLVFDFTENTPAGVRRMMDAASSFIDTQLRDQDLVSLWMLSKTSGLELSANLTNDRSYLKACLKRMEQGGRLPFEGYAAGVADLVGPWDVWGSRTDVVDTMGWYYPQERERNKFEERVRRETFLDELERLARVISGMPGRKFCLLFSRGFELQRTIGTSEPIVGATQERVIRNPELAFAAFLEVPTREWRILDQLDRITRRFSTADCQLYTLDTTGLYSDPNLGMSGGGEQRLFADGLDSLGLLAEQTGGDCYKNMNNLSKPISMLMNRTKSYYLLGYRTPQRTGERAQKRFHRIDVRVRREGMQVRHRPGYSESAEPPAFGVESAWIELAAMALYDLPRSGIAFTPAAFTAPAAGGQAAVSIAFEVPGAQFVGGAGDLPLEFYVFALDQNDQVSRYARGAHVVGGDLLERVGRTGVRYTNQLLLPSGREYTLRFIVRSGRDGSVGTASVKVAAASLRNGLFITGPIFPAGSSSATGAAASWLNLKETATTPGGDSSGSVLAWGGKQFSPDLSPFDAAVRRTVLVKVYANRPQVHAEDVTLECEVLDASGVVVARPELPNAAPAQLGDGHVDYLLWIDPRDFPPGAATMRITAADKVTGATARSQVALGGLTAATGVLQQ